MSELAIFELYTVRVIQTTWQYCLHNFRTILNYCSILCFRSQACACIQLAADLQLSGLKKLGWGTGDLQICSQHTIQMIPGIGCFKLLAFIFYCWVCSVVGHQVLVCVSLLLLFVPNNAYNTKCHYIQYWIAYHNLNTRFSIQYIWFNDSWWRTISIAWSLVLQATT